MQNITKRKTNLKVMTTALYQRNKIISFTLKKQMKWFGPV